MALQFTDLELNDQLLEALSYMGFEEATPIQEQTIPEILKGRDIIACAQTGTGKTAAFILPVLNRLSDIKRNGIMVLIIVPTRELAIQIEQQVQGFAYFVGIDSVSIYGGGDGINWEDQKKALVHGTDIIVATPGKLISHINMGYVNFNNLKYLILDEADRMLDQGFHDDIIKIIKGIPEKRQTLLFSATFPSKIKSFSKKILKNPFEVSIAMSKPAEGVLQAAYLIYNPQKIELLKSLIADKPDYKSILIFSSTKKKVFDIVRALKGNGYTVEGISSDLEQKDREEALRGFRSKRTRVVVATDVLSRGIDIKDINLVVNFDVPNEAEDYVHRIGRTARADTTGVALTFVNEDEMFKFSRIEQLIEREVPKILLPPELGDGPIWKLPHKRSHGKQRRFVKNRGKKRN